MERASRSAVRKLPFSTGHETSATAFTCCRVGLAASTGGKRGIDGDETQILVGNMRSDRPERQVRGTREKRRVAGFRSGARREHRAEPRDRKGEGRDPSNIFAKATIYN